MRLIVRMELRVLLLSDIDSPHVQKWAKGLAAHKIHIGIFSLNHADTDWYSASGYITCLSQRANRQSNTLLAKLMYVFLLPKLIYQIIKFKPTVIHAHYATSYGLLGALTFFKPLLVSAWGSDVIDFPKKSLLHRFILKFVFYRAHKICATSLALKNKIAVYTSKPVIIIPFGINLNEFYVRSMSQTNHPFTFGCIKHFEKIYNIDKVVLAFALVVKKYPTALLKLKLVGDGSERELIKAMVLQLDLSNRVEFVGKVPHAEVPYYLNTIDVFVNVSEYESFGVAVAEAMACKVPVIVSNTEGFKDLVPGPENALITPTTNPADIASAMEVYLLNDERRALAVTKSYALISEKFNWKNNLEQMEKVYFEFAAKVA